MVDVARLGIAVDSSDLATGSTALKGFAAEGKRTEAQIVKSADRMERELAQTANATRLLNKQMSGNLGGSRMMAMQLSQVGQQTMATGNFVQSLAIQLPDLALGFGAVGIMGGVAAGVLLQLAPAFFGANDEASNFEDSLKSLRAVSDGLNEPLDILKTSVVDLEKVYGTATDRVLQFALAQAELRAGQASVRLSEQVSIMDSLTTSFMTSSESGSRFESTMRRINDAFGVTGAEAVELEQAFQDLYVADNFQDQQVALQNILGLLQDYGVDLRTIPEELGVAITEMITLSNETDAAAALTAQLADRAAEVAPALQPAVGVASALKAELAAALALFNAISLQESKTYSGRGEDPRRFEEGGNLDGYENRLGYTPVSELITQLTPKVPRGAKARGGGGGRSSAASKASREAQKAQNDLNREAERIIEGLRTEQEKYNDDLAQAKRLLDAGALSQEQYNKHVEQLGIELQDSKFGELRDEIDNLSDALAGGEDGIRSYFETLKREALSALISQGIQGLLGMGGGKKTGGGLLGGLLGGLFSGLPSNEGGGYTGSGSRTGGVDGRGGILSINHPDETIIDHRKGQSVSNNGGQMDVRVYVDEDGNWQAKVEQITNSGIQKAAPGIASQSVSRAQASFRNSKSGWSP